MWSDAQELEVGDDISTKAITATTPTTDWNTVAATSYAGLAVGSAAVAGYYGYRRGGFWGMVGWAVAGFVFPIVTPTVAVVRRKRR